MRLDGERLKLRRWPAISSLTWFTSRLIAEAVADQADGSDLRLARDALTLSTASLWFPGGLGGLPTPSLHPSFPTGPGQGDAYWRALRPTATILTPTQPIEVTVRRIASRLRGMVQPTTGLLARSEDWIVTALPGLGIEKQVTHAVVEHGKNALRLDHLIPLGPLGGKVAFRVTTKFHVLPSASFRDAQVRGEINAASRRRGRVIYCMRADLDEVMSAIAYHVPATGPLAVRAIALRQDPGKPEIWAQSRHAAVMCKAYLHIFAEKLERTGDLVYEADTRAKVEEATAFIGFRRAKRPTGFRPSGRELLCQRKLGR